MPKRIRLETGGAGQPGGTGGLAGLALAKPKDLVEGKEGDPRSGHQPQRVRENWPVRAHNDLALVARIFQKRRKTQFITR